MHQAARLQILHDIGIDVWRLRAAAGESVADSQPGEAAAVLAELEIPRVREPSAMPRAAVDTPLPDAAEDAAEPVREAAPSAVGAAGESAGPAASPWAAISLALPGIVVVVDGASSRRDLRLAVDILAAATGDWRARPARRRFDWPPAVSAPAVATDEPAGRRALAAFLEKDLADHGAAVLVCVETLAAHLPEAVSGATRIEIPPLDELGRDTEAKRALWQRLASALR